MQITVKLPQTGFVPGQAVPVVVDIINDSGTCINYFRLLLKKVVLYHCTTPKPKTRRQKEIVVNNRVEKKAPGSGSTQAVLSLEIPSVPPTNITHNRVIHITYELKVCAKTSRCSDDVEIRVPIVIGTVPLMSGALGMASTSGGPGGPGGPGGQGFNPNLRELMQMQIIEFSLKLLSIHTVNVNIIKLPYIPTHLILMENPISGFNFFL